MTRPREGQRRTWAHRAFRRQRLLIDWALASPKRPLPMTRWAALVVGCRLAEAELHVRLQLDGLRQAFRR